MAEEDNKEKERDEIESIDIHFRDGGIERYTGFKIGKVQFIGKGKDEVGAVVDVTSEIKEETPMGSVDSVDEAKHDKELSVGEQEEKVEAEAQRLEAVKKKAGRMVNEGITDVTNSIVANAVEKEADRLKTDRVTTNNQSEGGSKRGGKKSRKPKSKRIRVRKTRRRKH